MGSHSVRYLNLPLDATSRHLKWHGVAWSGMEWHGVAWRGMAWSGVEWRGVEWRGVAWSCVELRGGGNFFFKLKWHEVA